MTLDIRTGDALATCSATSTEYPIKSVSLYVEDRLGTTRAFTKVATQTYLTRRAPAISSGKRGKRATNLTGLAGTPIDPVSPERRSNMMVQSPHELCEVYITDGDGYARLIVERRVTDG